MHVAGRVRDEDLRPGAPDRHHGGLDAARAVTALRVVGGAVEDPDLPGAGLEGHPDDLGHDLRVGVRRLLGHPVEADVRLDHASPRSTKRPIPPRISTARRAARAGGPCTAARSAGPQGAADPGGAESEGPAAAAPTRRSRQNRRRGASTGSGLCSSSTFMRLMSDFSGELSILGDPAARPRTATHVPVDGVWSRRRGRRVAGRVVFSGCGLRGKTAEGRKMAEVLAGGLDEGLAARASRKWRSASSSRPCSARMIPRSLWASANRGSPAGPPPPGVRRPRPCAQLR